MANRKFEREKGAAARASSSIGFKAGFVVLTGFSLSACGPQATTQMPEFAATANSTARLDFPIVHAQDRTPDGRRHLRLDSSKGMLEIDYLDGSVVTRKAMVKVGMQPVSVRAESNARAWVVDPIADSITIVDLGSATVTGTLQTGPQPSDVLFSGSPSRAYVTLAGGRELLVFDPLTPAEPPTRIALQLPSRQAVEDDI